MHQSVQDEHGGPLAPCRAILRETWAKYSENRPHQTKEAFSSHNLEAYAERFPGWTAEQIQNLVDMFSCFDINDDGQR